MTRSTLGFIFSKDLSQVLLITKQKPAFHQGLLNGLGGKCEGTENYLTCIQREVTEEAGLMIQDWLTVGELQWQDWDVKIFTALTDDSQELSQTAENVAWYPVNPLPRNIITNLAWLIPLCLDILKTQQKINVKIKYA